MKTAYITLASLGGIGCVVGLMSWNSLRQAQPVSQIPTAASVGMPESESTFKATPLVVKTRREGFHVKLAPSSSGLILQGQAIELRKQAYAKLEAGNAIVALTLLKEALLKSRTISDVYAVAELCQALGKNQEALSYYREFFDPHDNAGSTLDHDYDAMSKYLQVAEIVGAPEVPQLRQRVGLLGLDGKRSRGVLYPEIPARINDYAEAAALRGIAAFDTGNYSGALKQLELANKLAPNEPTILIMLASAALDNGAKPRALQLLKRSVELGGDIINPTLRNSIAWRSSGKVFDELD